MVCISSARDKFSKFLERSRYLPRETEINRETMMIWLLINDRITPKMCNTPRMCVIGILFLKQIYSIDLSKVSSCVTDCLTFLIV